MTDSDILRIAKEQSATDLNCSPRDFDSTENVVVTSAANDGARKYLKLPFICNLVTYGSNIVASVSGEIADGVRQFISSFPAEHCFETPNMLVLDEYLKRFGARVCFMAEYFLPDLNKLKRIDCGYKTKVLRAEDFCGLYTDEWSNALCRERKELDVLAVGAYDGDKLIGLAGCSADCEKMWQIGVDVLPAYRRRKVASALTSRLALEILNAGKTPFYCAAWSNIKSVKNALKCGFVPAWAEMTARDISTVDKYNKNLII